MTATALATYYIIYGWISATGMIYSSNVSILHMYLLGAIWTDRRFGWWVIFTNLAFFWQLYQRTLEVTPYSGLTALLGDPLSVLIINGLITIFLGGFLAYLLFDHERDRVKIKYLQDKKIEVLDEAVKKRTDQLNHMRENIATDFHDETGNMLAAITRQAGLLQQRLKTQEELLPMVNSILVNSRKLYATSKDFLWHLNHESDDPYELFLYLTEYGQLYYNQFDIAFSSECQGKRSILLEQSAALQLIYIFKEAMANVVSHSGANEVVLTLDYFTERICFGLKDDGRWKEPDETVKHYGLQNIYRRCKKHGFQVELKTLEGLTEIRIFIEAIEGHNKIMP